MSIPFVPIGPSIGGDNSLIYISGPVNTLDGRRLVVPYGDDYAADFEITLHPDINFAGCVAFFAISKLDEPSIRLQKPSMLFTAAEKKYARLDLVRDDFLILKLGRYAYDIEVRTEDDMHGTKISDYMRIVRTIVDHE
jgi:hypothetical protein